MKNGQSVHLVTEPVVETSHRMSGQTNQSTSKSRAKRRRDAERIAAYKNRIKVMTALPFHELSNIEITNVMQRDTTKDQLNSLRDQNKELKCAVKYLRSKCDALASENVKFGKLSKQMQEENEDNTRSLQNQCKEFEKAIDNRNKKMKSKDREIAMLKLELCDFEELKREHSDTSRKLSELEQTVCNLKSVQTIKSTVKNGNQSSIGHQSQPRDYGIGKYLPTSGHAIRPHSGQRQPQQPKPAQRLCADGRWRYVAHCSNPIVAAQLAIAQKHL